MPHKIKTGWKWANVKRKTKGELAKTVYGIWKKNGSKGSFSDFWHGKDDGENTNESKVLSTGETTLSVNGLKTINNSRIGSECMNTKTNNATTLVESWGTPWQRITTRVINEYNVDDEEPDVFENEFGNPIDQVADDMENEQTPRDDDDLYQDEQLQSYFGKMAALEPLRVSDEGAAYKTAYMIDKMAVAIAKRIEDSRTPKRKWVAFDDTENDWAEFGNALESISDNFFGQFWDHPNGFRAENEFTGDSFYGPESGNDPVKSNYGKQTIIWYLDQIKSMLSMFRKEVQLEEPRLVEAVDVLISFFNRKLYKQTAALKTNFAFKMK